MQTKTETRVEHSFDELAAGAMQCAREWRAYAEKRGISTTQRRNAVKLSFLFINQNVLLTLMAEEEKEHVANGR